MGKNTSETCICCGTETGGRTICPYCGFAQIIAMDAAGEQTNVILKNEHHKELIGSLQNFSVRTYFYRWNEASSKLDLESDETIKLADGSDCDRRVCWSKENFGQTLGSPHPVTLTIGYLFEGVQKQVSVKLKRVQCNDFWKLGVMIDKRLRLVVYLGTEQTYVTSDPVDLELV